MNITILQRNIRRYFEVGLSRSSPRRALLLCGFIFLVFLYLFLLRAPSEIPSPVGQCIIDQFAQKYADFTPKINSPSFIGNGFIGVDASLDRQLLVSQGDDSTLKLPIYTAFRPLVDVSLSSLVEDVKVQFVSDYREGMSRAVQCSVIGEKCFCIHQFMYAHRTRPNLLIHEIRIANPTTSSIEVKFNRRGNPDWEQTISGSLPVYLKVFNEFSSVEKDVVAVVCSSVPLTVNIIKAQTEENFRFLCVVDKGKFSQTTDESEAALKRRLSLSVTEKFGQFNSLNSRTLDLEHITSWNKLNQAAFNISHSKAPGALNAELINVTRYGLLSTVRAPLFESGGQTMEERKIYEENMAKTELCYTGHSTLLTPSKLWQEWGNVQELLRTMEIWLMTLEHRGCIHILKAGAHGVAQAFLLSVIAATFTHHRLESTLDPESDLHRHIRVDGLRFSAHTSLNLNFDLDESNRPFAEISVDDRTSNSVATLYACSAGCLDEPSAVGRQPIRLAIKMTKPPTPILFITEKKDHLTQVKDVLHVVEVIDAPTAESHKVDLHRHGQNDGGLPTIFWVVLVFMLISFHLFLFKLLYSEWKNSISIPITYSKMNKTFLLRR